jgi:hypothetical protein
VDSSGVLDEDKNNDEDVDEDDNGSSVMLPGWLEVEDKEVDDDDEEDEGEDDPSGVETPNDARCCVHDQPTNDHKNLFTCQSVCILWQ